MNDDLVPLETITQQIYLLRGQKVLLDADLAALYGVTTKRFNEQVKRNLARFPTDFMFQLTEQEFEALRSQNATSKYQQIDARGGRRYRPYAFTEHGAIMAATVLNSSRAVQVSVYVVRAFIKLRELIMSNTELGLRLSDLEHKTELMAMRGEAFEHAAKEQLKQIFDAIRQMMTPPEAPPKRPIGFLTPTEKAHKSSAPPDA